MQGQDVSTTQRIYRARRTSVTFGRVYLGIKAHQFIARRLRPSDMRERWSRFNRSSAESIYRTAVDLRGLILKGCQFLGARADILPREYVEVLSRLQDRVPAQPLPVVRDLIESEFGRRLGEVFEAFSPRPLASASLAQVHEARLRGGRRVAVKVQYPEIAALVRGDLSNLEFLFRAVGMLERDLDLMPLIEELSQHVPLELDFVNEGHNAERVAKLFAHRDDLRVPAIVWEHTTRRVLVMEFMEGTKITDVEGLRRAGIDAHAVAQLMVEAWCEQILVHGFFQADPHPGNLLVQPGPRLVLLDFGLAKSLPADFRGRVVDVALAVLRGDAPGLAEALVALGFETRDGSAESLLGIARLVIEVGTRLRDRPFASEEILRDVGEELPEMVRANPLVRIPSHVVLLGRVLGLLSGVSRQLGSRVDLLRTILPYAIQGRPV